MAGIVCVWFVLPSAYNAKWESPAPTKTLAGLRGTPVILYRSTWQGALTRQRYAQCAAGTKHFLIEEFKGSLDSKVSPIFPHYAEVKLESVEAGHVLLDSNPNTLPIIIVWLQAEPDLRLHCGF